MPRLGTAARNGEFALDERHCPRGRPERIPAHSASGRCADLDLVTEHRRDARATAGAARAVLDVVAALHPTPAVERPAVRMLRALDAREYAEQP